MESCYSQGAVYQPIHKYCSFKDLSVDGRSGCRGRRAADLLLAPVYEDVPEALYSPPNPLAIDPRANDTNVIGRMGNPADILLASMFEDSIPISDAQNPTNAVERVVTFMPPQLSGTKSSGYLHPQVLPEGHALTIEIKELEFSWDGLGLAERKTCHILFGSTTLGPVCLFSAVDLVVSVCSTTNSGTADTAEAILIGDSGGSGTTKKRKREGNKDEDIEPHRDGESSLQTAKKRARDGVKRLGFACPFFKKDAVRFRICCNFTAKKISHVKQHLNRVHFRPSCFRCYAVFSSDEQLNRHLMEAVACDVRVVTEFDLITIGQRDALSHRSNPRSTKEEQWFFIFEVLFPGRPRPRSPYIETGLSTEMSVFADFIRDRMAQRLHERLSADPDAFKNNLFSETQDIISTIIADFAARWATDSRDSNGPSFSSARSVNTLSTVTPPERVAREASSSEGRCITDPTPTPLPTSLTTQMPNQRETAIDPSKFEEPSATTSADLEISDQRAVRSQSEPLHIPDQNNDVARPQKTDSIDAGSKYRATTAKVSCSEPADSQPQSEDRMPKTGGPTEADATKNEPLCSESNCNAKFKTMKDLARHKNSKHQKSILYPCPDCGKNWTRKDNMVRHRRTLHGFTGIEPMISEV